jgi:hypothetical protein
MEASPAFIPLARILSQANELVTHRLIEKYAIGGAIAAIYYTEPVATYDVDLFFIPADKGLTAGIPAIYAHLQDHGWRLEREHLLCDGFPVQFLAAAALTEEAVRESRPATFENVPTHIFRAEHVIAIAAQVGRAKDISRILQLREQVAIDANYLADILKRHGITLPV